jgi:hypothetical protein
VSTSRVHAGSVGDIHRLVTSFGRSLRASNLADRTVPPGHIPVANEPGTEFVSFSPSEELRIAEAVMMKNMLAMQASTPPA